MKKVTFKSPVDFRADGEVTKYLPRHEYQISDSLAEHPFLSQYIKTIEDCGADQPVRTRRRRVRTNESDS